MTCEICNKSFGNKGALFAHKKSCRKLFHEKDKIISLYVDDKLSIRMIRNIYHVGADIISNIIGDNLRSREDINKIISIKSSGRRHTEESKKKIGDSTKKWMKENPEKTAWRLSNLSYPEKIFQNKLKELGLDRKYQIVRERSFYPYYIDFAFENQKIAVEIDGSQHENEDRKESDRKKDLLLTENGWRVLRFSAKKISRETLECFAILDSYLGNEDVSPGIFRYNDIKEIIKEKNYCTCGKEIYKGCKLCVICEHLRQRKVQRPTYQQLLQEIQEFGYAATGRRYGVSDNSIRKWIKMYEKYGENY